MTKAIKKPVSILLSILMVISLFAVMPGISRTVSAEQSDRLYSISVTDTQYQATNTLEGSASLPYTVTGTELLKLLNYGSYHAHHISIEDIGDDILTVSGTDITFNKAGSESIRVYTAETAYVPCTITIVSGYTITWKNEDGTVIDKTAAVEGTFPPHSAPSKPSRDNVSYNFAGWTPEVTTATADAEYTATFTTVAGHKHDNITFSPWESATSLPSSGDYYLTCNVTLSQMTQITAGLRLCLNGHTITFTGDSSVFLVYGGTFELYDDTNTGSITGGKGTNGNGGGVFVYSGYFNMYGGNITGCSCTQYGGGVIVLQSYFNMYGGSITNCSADKGGGVFNYGGIFNMYGGSISENSSTTKGGGVYVFQGMTRMYGGSVSENSSTTNGGGIYVYDNSTLEMNGGSVNGNTTNSYGGGIFVGGSILRINGGAIKNNSSVNFAGGIYVDTDSTFIMNEGSVTDNAAREGGGVVSAPDAVISGGFIARNRANKYSGLYADGDLELSGGIVTQNSAVDYGGLYVKGTLKLSGGSVTGNTARVAPNIVTASVIKITGSLPVSSRFDLYYCDTDLNPLTGVFTSGYGQYNTPFPTARFHVDSNDYAIIMINDEAALVPTPATVTWMSEGKTLATESVPVGNIPEYKDTAPTKEETAQYTYTFIGWRDSSRTYGLTEELPVVSGDVTFTAQFQAIRKPYFVGRDLSFDGKIGVYFYVNISEEEAQNATLSFVWGNWGKPDVSLEADPKGTGYYRAACYVDATDMSKVIYAGLKINGNFVAIDTYSIKDYAIASDCDPRTSGLIKAMLNFGATSQAYFDPDVAPEDLANASLDDEDKVIADIKPAKIKVDSPKCKLQNGVKFVGASLALQSDTILSIYLTSKKVPELYECEGHEVELDVSGKYTILRIKGIKAEELGNDLTLSIIAGEKESTITYNPMYYVRSVLQNKSADEGLKTVLKSLYWYWQAAKEYAEAASEILPC